MMSENSKLCVGCMSFGKAGTMHDWTLDEAQTDEMVAGHLARPTWKSESLREEQTELQSESTTAWKKPI